MPAERAPMRKVREVLRLRHALGVSERQIAITTGVSRSTVGEYLRRAAVIGISWPVPEGLDDAELERRLFTPAGFHEGSTKPLPDWTKVHEELKRRGVTLMILWEEHAPRMSMATDTPASVSFTANGEGASRRRCDRPTWQAISCSSTGLVTRCRSSIR